MKFVRTLAVLAGVLLVSTSFAVTFISDFDVPENASGITHDGEALWIGFIGDRGEEILKITDYDGEPLDTMTAPADGCYGLNWSGNMLWYLNDEPEERVYALSPLGNIVTEWELPGEFMSGICNGEGDVWVGSYYQPSRYIYRLDSSTGDSLGILPAPVDDTKYLAWQDGTIWVTDGDSNLITQIDAATGDSLDSFESPNGSPKGLAYDGDWLWLLDDGPGDDADRVYKIDSSPAIPIALVDPLEFNFGAVDINTDSSIVITVTNIGRATLNINQLEFVGNPTAYTFDAPETPVQLNEYESTTFTLTFSPPALGQYNSPYVYITTNDVNFSYHEFVINGIGGYPQPRLEAVTLEDPIQFGTVRMQQELDAMQVRYYVFKNLGAPQLYIESFESTDPDFFLAEELSQAEPMVINGGQTDSLAIWWRPTEPGFVEESFTITTNDDFHPFITVGLTGVANDELLIGGEVLWEYDNDADEWFDGYAFVGEMSDVAGIGHNAVVGLTARGQIDVLNSNANDEGQILYSRMIEIPGTDTTGLINQTGFISRPEMVTVIDDLDDDGYRDLVFGTDGHISGGGAGAGIIMAISGFDGSLIWYFDTATIGSAPVREVLALDDMDGDDHADILVTLGYNTYDNGPQATMIMNGPHGYPVWMSSQLGNYYTATPGPDTNGDGLPEIIAGTLGNVVYALDGATGYPIWSTVPGGGTYKVFTVSDIGGSDEQDIVITGEYGVMALDPTNGEEFWHVDYLDDATHAVYTGEVFINDTIEDQIAVGRSNGQIAGVFLDDGDVFWTRNMGSSPRDMKLVSDLDEDGNPEIAVGTAGSRMIVYKGDGTDVRWSYTEGGGSHWVHSVAEVNDVEGNFSSEVLCGTRTGTLRMFTGGLAVTNDVDKEIRVVMPGSYSVQAAYPNPFNSAIRLAFQLPTNSTVPVYIYDRLGRQVDQLSITPANGQAITTWQPSAGLATGVYFIRIDNASSAATRVMYVK